jgi:hypothetical protein
VQLYGRGTELSKYRRANVVYWGVNAFLILLSVFGLINVQPSKVTSFLPFENVYLEMPLVFIAMPLSATLGALVGGYLLSPVYLWVHRVVFRGSEYVVREVSESDGFPGMFNGFYPALLAFNMNSLIMDMWPGVLDRLLSSQLLAAPFTYRYSFGSVVLMAGTIGLSMVVFSPAYFLIDGGVIYSTEEKAKRLGRPGEVRTVGGWFNDYLRGYAGLSVALSYFLFVFRYVMAIEMELIFVLFWFGLPFFVTVSTIPSFIYLDKKKETRMRYISSVAERRGISSMVKNEK